MKIANNFSEGRLLAVCLRRKNANSVDLLQKEVFYTVYEILLYNFSYVVLEMSNVYRHITFKQRIRQMVKNRQTLVNLVKECPLDDGQLQKPAIFVLLSGILRNNTLDSRQAVVRKSFFVDNTVDSGNSKRLNTKQSLISKHFLVQTPIVL